MSVAIQGAIQGGATRRMVRRPNAAKSGWSTPGLLRVGIYLAVLASAFMTIAAMAGAWTARDALRTIGREAAPGVLAAEHIRGALSAMDESAVEELLTRSAGTATFETRRKEAADAIIRATEDISFRDVERVPLQQLGLGLGAYTAQIQQARDEFASGDRRYAEAYRTAAKMMDADLQPSAQRLETSMRNILDGSLRQALSMLRSLVAALTGAAFVTAGILLYLQFFLARRMRRVFNPLVFGATLATMAFAGYAVNSLSQESLDLQFANDGPFARESARLELHASHAAFALGESRHRLDPRSFAGSTLPGRNPESMVSETQNAAAPNPVELEAVMERGYQELAGFDLTAPLAELLIIFLTYLGIRPRLQEYAA